MFYIACSTTLIWRADRHADHTLISNGVDMLLRVLFVLLTALNIAVGAWVVFGQNDALGRSATDPGVPMLQLLSEQRSAPSTVKSVEVVAAPATTRSAPSTRSINDSCVSLGPFAAEQALVRARTALEPQNLRMRSRQEHSVQAHGWRVYLPASANHAQALEQARRLAAKHIAEYFVITDGAEANTISLGLFKDPANARKRRDEVAAAGFSAQMSARSDIVPEYWLDLAVPKGSSFDWRAYVGNADIGSHSAACF